MCGAVVLRKHAHLERVAGGALARVLHGSEQRVQADNEAHRRLKVRVRDDGVCGPAWGGHVSGSHSRSDLRIRLVRRLGLWCRIAHLPTLHRLCAARTALMRAREDRAQPWHRVYA